MIKSIRIKNFQGHEDTAFDFDKGITVITGSSCSGKSTILRAIRWVLENRPSGNSHISYWNRKKDGSPLGDTLVTLELDNGTITRIKSPEINGYVVDKDTLATIGLDVPQAVLTSLNISDLNVHKQFAPHFLISETSGEVSRYLNKLINLDIIDNILSIAERNVRTNKAETVSLQEQLEEVNKGIEELAFVAEAEKLVEALMFLNDKHQKDVSKQSALNVIVAKYKKLNADLLVAKSLLEKTLPLVNKIEEVNKDVKSDRMKATNLKTVIDNMMLHTKIISQRELVERSIKLVNRVEIIKKEVIEFQSKRVKLFALLDSIKSTETDIVRNKASLETAKSNLPELCPTCGKPMEGK
jgi:DNA repair protein SbcC/Rad50